MEKKPNIHKFAKILICDEKKGNITSKFQIPENLYPFYWTNLTNSVQKQKLSSWIKKNKTFLFELDRLLREEKYLKTPETIRNYDGLLEVLLLPELIHLRHIARINLMQISHATINNDIQKALKAYRTSHRAMEYALDDHCMISFLVGLAVEAIRLYQLQIIVESKMLSDQQIRQIIVQLTQDMSNWDKQCERAMYGETVICLNTILTVTRPMNESLLFETGYFSDETDYRRMEDEFFDFNDYLFQFLLAPIQSIYSEDLLYSVNTFILGAPIPADPEYFKKSKNIPDRHILSRMALGSYMSIHKKIKCIRSQQQAAIMALCVELYRRKKGKLPESLNELIPEYIDKIYLDQFTGKPMKYIKGNYQAIMSDYRNESTPEPDSELIKVQGYRIYSVGPNKQNEKGLQGSLNNKWHDDFGFSVIDKIISPVRQ